MIVLVVFHPDIEEGDALTVKARMIGRVGPIIRGPVMPEGDRQAALAGQLLQGRPEKRIVAGATHIQLIVGVAPNHVHIQVEEDVFQRHGRFVHKGGSAL